MPAGRPCKVSFRSDNEDVRPTAAQYSLLEHLAALDLKIVEDGLRACAEKKLVFTFFLFVYSLSLSLISLLSPSIRLSFLSLLSRLCPSSQSQTADLSS